MNEVTDHNTALFVALYAACGPNGKGYAPVSATRVVHAARGIVRGWGGFNHPRPMCQGHTSRVFFGLLPPDRTVTCQRCIAALAKRGIPT